MRCAIAVGLRISWSTMNWSARYRNTCPEAPPHKRIETAARDAPAAPGDRVPRRSRLPLTGQLGNFSGIDETLQAGDDGATAPFVHD